MISARWPLPSGAIRSMTPGAAVGNRRILDLEAEHVFRIERREVIEIDLMTDVLGLVEIDLVDLEQGEIALAVLGRANLTVDGIAGTQAQAADLARADVDIVRTRQIIGFRRAQEAEPVLENFQHAAAGDFHVLFGELFENSEHHVLLAQGARILDLELFGEIQKLGRRFTLQLK